VHVFRFRSTYTHFSFEMGVQRYLFILKNEMNSQKKITLSKKIVDNSFFSFVVRILNQATFALRIHSIC
jgi:hypothetical protein